MNNATTDTTTTHTQSSSTLIHAVEEFVKQELAKNDGVSNNSNTQ
jgi:hypothetical protein